MSEKQTQQPGLPIPGGPPDPAVATATDDPLQQLANQIVEWESQSGELPPQEVEELVAELHQELEEAAQDRELAQSLIESARNRGRASEIVKGIGVVGQVEAEASEQPRAKAGKGKYGKRGLKRARATRARNRVSRAAISAAALRGEEATSESMANGWEKLQAGNVTLNPEEHILADGRHHLRFVRSYQNRHELTAESEPFVAYMFRSHGREALLLGLFVPREMRGRGLGRQLFQYFLDGLKERGIDFAGTGLIHKPETAMLMKQLGLEPEHKDMLAALMPSDGKVGPPKVYFVRESHRRHGDVVTSSRGGRVFYDRVTTPPAGGQIDPKSVVALHTRYRLPKDRSR